MALRRGEGPGGKGSIYQRRSNGHWTAMLGPRGRRRSFTDPNRDKVVAWLAAALEGPDEIATLNEHWVEVVGLARRIGDNRLLAALHRFSLGWRQIHERA